MDKLEALRKVLEDPARSDAEKSIARAALLQIRKPNAHEAELLQKTGADDLRSVNFQAVWKFCNAIGWHTDEAKRLYETWLGFPLWETA